MLGREDRERKRVEEQIKRRGERGRERREMKRKQTAEKKGRERADF